jgi:hypothetical protein
MKSWYFISLIFFVVLSGYSQSVHFRYDANGNRTSRYIEGTPEKDNLKTDSLDSIQYVQAVITGVQQKQQFTVYPNPSPGEFTLKFDNNLEDQILLLRIYNVSGVLLLAQKEMNNKVNCLDLGKYGSGIYFLSIDFPGGSYKTKLVVL